MADVLLTHSYHLPYDPKQVRKMQPYPPLGTLYAASALKSENISVAVFDTMLEEPITGFTTALKEHCPKLVVIYEDDFNFLSKMCLTRMRELAWELTVLARQAGTVVIAHGSDATDQAESYLHHGIDFVLLGEAEKTLGELCSAILSGRQHLEIPGLLYLDEKGQIARSAGKPPKNSAWNTLPRPSRELIDLSPYRHAWLTAHGYFSTNVVASRGCPYGCNWCAKPISGNKFQIRPAKSVAMEIHELKEVYGVEHIWFGDDVFALNHQWVQSFADEIEAMKCAIPFKIQSRADLMTDATVAGLKRAGCAEIWMGVESGSQKILDAMDKGLRISDITTARDLLAQNNIRACFFLQFGYPGETWEEIQQTIELVRALRPDDIGISFSYPLPGTVFFDRVQEQIGSKRNWTDSDDLCLMFSAAYSDDFYMALRKALHAEVDHWKNEDALKTEVYLDTLWQRVYELESITKNSKATILSAITAQPTDRQFVPLQALTPATRQM
ncbi:radical SAM protein [Granulicella sp. S190]|uniref:B12-binding domain-containing radical SAM protein n=1 Tax=Granulicella sp. S190 TaxID=1747226 RepID=UPI00131CB219|nr:radical SAM protein [Granulicella sp. S190]